MVKNALAIRKTHRKYIKKPIKGIRCAGQIYLVFPVKNYNFIKLFQMVTIVKSIWNQNKIM